jgi:hypothetical protein
MYQPIDLVDPSQRHSHHTVVIWGSKSYLSATPIVLTTLKDWAAGHRAAKPGKQQSDHEKMCARCKALKKPFPGAKCSKHPFSSMLAARGLQL